MRRQLTEAFGEVGAVVSVRLPTDRDTGELKGIGFIEFESTDAKVGGLRAAWELWGGAGGACMPPCPAPLHLCTAGMMWAPAPSGAWLWGRAAAA